MGKFKLGSPRVNPLKSRGFMSNSPFTENGNTMAYNKEGEETNKPAKSEEEAQNIADEKANKNVENAEKKVVGRSSSTRQGEQNGIKGTFTDEVTQFEQVGRGEKSWRQAYDDALAKGWRKPDESFDDYVARAKRERMSSETNTTFKPDENKPEPEKPNLDYLKNYTLKQPRRGKNKQWGGELLAKTKVAEGQEVLPLNAANAQFFGLNPDTYGGTAEDEKIADMLSKQKTVQGYTPESRARMERKYNMGNRSKEHDGMTATEYYDSLLNYQVPEGYKPFWEREGGDSRGTDNYQKQLAQGKADMQVQQTATNTGIQRPQNLNNNFIESNSQFDEEQIRKMKALNERNKNKGGAGTRTITANF
jgi:hypothetical protein